MNITQNLLLYILLLISLLKTTKSHICSPSSCGDIHNISSPFRLKNDPKHCGYPDYELACENNVTVISLNSQKYQVKAINYHNSTIKLLDVSINNNTCSFPKHSLYPETFENRRGYPYSAKSCRGYYYRYQDCPELAWPINFMSCPYPFNNSSLLTETNDCDNRDGHVLDASNRRHTYIKVGHMNASDVGDMCRIDVIALTSYKFDDLKKNVSVSEIHESLFYGFELSWSSYPCSKCQRPGYCYPGEDYSVTCGPSNSTVTLVVVISIVMLLAEVICVPVRVIFVFISIFFFGVFVSLYVCKNYYSPLSHFLKPMI